MRQLLRIFFLTFIINVSKSGHSQGQSGSDNIISFPGKIIGKVNQRIETFDSKLITATRKSLGKMQRREQRLKRKLEKVDSAAAADIFKNSQSQYESIIHGLENNQLAQRNRVGEYFPFLDSLNTSLKFLDQHRSNKNHLAGTEKNISSALQSLGTMQDRLKNISSVQKYLKQRKSLLQEQLEKYGLSKQLKKLNKEVYYYSSRISEYKSQLSDPRKLELAAFRVLNKIPSFSDFFEKNSFIASIFGASNFSSFNNATSSIPDLPGLQSRTQIEQIINSDLLNVTGSGSEDPKDILRSKLSTAKEELDKIKTKNSNWDENSEMPDFKPNDMKGKSLLDKLEFGTNLQFGKPNAALPSTADIGAQVAYKFHQNGDIGIGASYKMGYGTLRRLSISHQGVGLRTFLDYRLKGKFFINGGFEYNYNAAFQDIEELKRFDSWQKSALLGLSRKYKISKKLKGNVILLYDFLHSQHIPVSQPIIFRVGYNF